MSKIYVEHALRRSTRPTVLILKKNGSCLSIAILQEDEDVWTGEAGEITPDECLWVVEELREWIMDPQYDDRGLREPCEIEVTVANYGIVSRRNGDDKFDGDPYPEVSAVTLHVETDSDASYVADLFLEMNRRLRGFQ